MTDRTHPGEAPGSEDGDGDGVDGEQRDGVDGEQQDQVDGCQGVGIGDVAPDGWESCAAGGTTNGSGPGSPAIRADGGDPSGELFAAIPDPVLRYEREDGSPVVTDANAAYRERFGVDGEIAGPLEQRLGTDLELPERDGGLARIDDLGELVQSAGVDAPARAIVRADTSSDERDYLARVVPRSAVDEPLQPEHGAGTGGFVVLTDVTAQLELTRDLVDQRDRLDEFASIVSHDLRNPLEVAEIQLEAARNRGDDVHFEKVADAHERMERIVGDVLTLARQGQVIDEVDDVRLSTVAADAWDSISAPEATLSVDADVVLRADADRLQELLENLFRNAYEHAGPAVTVTVGRAGEGFYVADDGPGIPEADREAVFEGGFSTDPDGTGLGLVIVDRIAAAHGWTVRVGAAEDGGARFDVSGVEIDP